MKMNEIMALIKSLASSQGFYGRLLNRLLEIKKYDKQTWNKIKKDWEGRKFGDSVDFVMYIEG